MKAILERYARWSARHPWRVLAGTAVVCALALLAMRNLSISADLGAVLPTDADSVRHLELVSRRLGSTDALYVSVQSPDARANRRFLDTVAEVVARWPEQPLILYRLDIRYFKERRLLYADLSDMERVRDNLERRLHWEKVHSNPAYIDLGDDPAPEVLPAGLRAKYEERYKGELGSVMQRGTETEVDEPESSDFLYLEKELEAKQPDGTTRTEWVTAMMIRFRVGSVDVDRLENVVYRAECLIGTRTGSDCRDLRRWPGLQELPADASIALQAKDFHPGMRAEVGGGIRQRVMETDALYKDVGASAIGSLVAMTLIVLLAFRRVRALLYVMVPLLVGIVSCLAIAALAFERLNVITAFTFAVLIGLGIDFGIHLGKRYEEERAGGLDNEDAVARAFGSTGRAMGVAMLTSVLAFATLTSSEFRGFSEFGQLCAVGVPLSMLAAYVLFPVVVTLADRVRPMKPRAGRPSVPPAVRRFTSRTVGWLVLGGVALTTLAAMAASTFLEFEYDYGKLGTKRAVPSRIDTGQATRGYTGSPAVGLARTPEEAQKAYRYLKRRYKEPNSPLKDVFSVFSFQPERQSEKLRVLSQLDLLMDDPAFGFFEDRLTDEELDRLDEWRTYLRAGAVDPLAPEFPQWAKDLFTELDLRQPIPADASPYQRRTLEALNQVRAPFVGRVLYLMPRGNMSNGLEALRMQGYFQTIRLPTGEQVPVAASGFVFADIIKHIQRDGSFVTGIALLAVFVVTFIGYRSLSRALITVTPLVVGIAWLLGLMVLLDVKLTFYSMVMLPVVIGTGIDASVHLYFRYQELGPGSILTVMRRTGPAVAISTLTTMAGFSSLMFTQHRGLASMGQVAALGLSTVLVATSVVLPALLLATERRKPPTPGDPPPPRERRRSRPWPFRPHP
ncbi:MAG: MMPL family transporter [Deltaproteobacteria bacterium]|nr:MMPL family transporter [Deltaproteobacteria bacterium]